jgi:hypothetical protein
MFCTRNFEYRIRSTRPKQILVLISDKTGEWGQNRPD